MKRYTHAWLAMMAMKRIEKANIPEKQKLDAEELVRWLKNHRDFVIKGSWYPDDVFCDMSSSHIVKYYSDETSRDTSFRRMPETLRMYTEFLDAPRRKKAFSIKDGGNLCDRCESFAESIIDNFKILYSEGQGAPITTTSNHIAMRFFILSHYIADAHMPLHCDARSFSGNNAVHGAIEAEWDSLVRASYQLDEPNDRFFYDPEGYPLKTGSVSPILQYVEDELVTRPFSWPWGPSYKDPSTGSDRQDCTNTWSYMSGITQCAYVMGDYLVLEDLPADKITTSHYKKTSAYTDHFDEYTKIILADAVESIAKVWLHVWARYRDWWRNRELAFLKEKADAAQKAYDKADELISNNAEITAKLKAAISEAEKKVSQKQKDLDDAIASGKSTKQKETYLNSAVNALKAAEDALQKHIIDYAEAKAEFKTIEANMLAFTAEHKARILEYKKYEDKKNNKI